MVNSSVMDKLIKIHNQKLNYYFELLNLSRQQKEEIVDEDLKKLNQIVDQKGEIIEKINQLDIQLQPYKKQVINNFNLNEEKWLLELTKKKQTSSKLEEIVDQLADILKKLSQLDKKNQNLLQDKKDKLKSELKGIKQGVQVNKSYGSLNNRIHSTYVDEKS